MRLENVTFDALDLRALAEFWCQALGWEKVYEADGEISVSTPGGDPDDPGTWRFPDLVFVPVDDPAAGRSRVHLDLASTSVDEQRATVERLRRLGATPADVGQAPDAPWVVLADPEGNPFCVLDPADRYEGTGPLAAVVVSVEDPSALRDFWAAATGWDLVEDSARAVGFRHPDGKGPLLELIARPGLDPGDARKNRIHLDVSPREDEDQGARVDELLALGGTRVDVGQGPDVRWVVLADPEGNEVCVLSSRP